MRFLLMLILNFLFIDKICSFDFYNSFQSIFMSNYPVFGCGLPSKPRAAEPSMFEILSWPNDNEPTQSKFQLNQEKIDQQEFHKNMNSNAENLHAKTDQIQQQTHKQIKHQSSKAKSSKKIIEQTYKEHKSLSKQKILVKQPIADYVDDEFLENKTKTFIQTKVHAKQIKHELYSYEPVHLRTSRQKSVIAVKKDEKLTERNPVTQQQQLDQKTINERKQKLKEFELFTRALPNSAFTTYYGKPAFQAYGRGTSGKNLKTFNIMPHKGGNHPKNLESHYTALMKGRNIKSKSYLPKKSTGENLVPSEEQCENEELKNINFALYKPDLIKSDRFATIRPNTAKKAGPPIMQKTTINGIKRNQTQAKQSKKVEKKTKKTKQKKINDGLKYLNERENLIDLLEEKKMKASQLAYKVTECYPSQLNVPPLKESFVSKENWSQVKAAGKASLKCDQVSDLLQSQLILNGKANQAL